MQKNIEEEGQDPYQKVKDVIDDQTRGTKNDEVYVIELDGIPFKKFTNELKQRLQKFTALQMLSIISCELESLELFPQLPALLRLDLVNNNIPGDDLKYLASSRHLQTLILSHNQVTVLEDLRYLTNLNELSQLDLFGNPVENLKEYRKKVFTMFKGLQILDSEDKTGEYNQATMTQAAQRIPSGLFEKKVSSAQQQVIRRISSQNDFAPVIFQQPIQKNIKEQKNNAPKQQQKQVLQPQQAQQQQQPQQQQIRKPVQRVAAKGKGGFQKKHSTSSRSGLTFPCGRIGRFLKQQFPTLRISAGTKVYLAAVLEYLTAEIIEVAGNAAKDNKKRRIIPVHIRNSLRHDQEFCQFLGYNTVFTESGAGLHSNFALAPQKQTKKQNIPQ